MADLLDAADELISRVTNRLLRRLPHARFEVRTARPIVSFTFDDVPDTALTAGAAILEKNGARGTFYIAGGLAGRQEVDRTLISADGCRTLLARGHEVACHTYAHSNIRHLSAAELVADLDQNARFLADIDPALRATNFAFPYNAGSFRARRELARRYRTARAGGEGINRGPTDRAFLRSVSIGQPEESAAALTRFIDDVVMDPGWLVFYTHDIAENSTPHGCRPETFEALVRHARDAGCEILTVNAALDQLGLGR